MNKTRKGIILAGGLGTRLKPLTDIISKQLLPIYNKPMIYYPLSVLIQIGVKEVLIISDRKNMPLYKNHLKNGKKFGIKIYYKVQTKPNGIASAYIIGKKFLNKNPSVLILGDNIFYGSNLIQKFQDAFKSDNSSLFTYEVDNPNAYGVIIKKSNTYKIIEKPKKFYSKEAIVGIYFLDNKAPELAKKLKFSKRGELEITDLNNIYLKNKKMIVTKLDKGTVWLDTGSFEGLLNASNFVRTLEVRQGIDITKINI
jgi:glucose-1-phosphate thymidylyltransferase